MSIEAHSIFLDRAVNVQQVEKAIHGVDHNIRKVQGPKAEAESMEPAGEIDENAPAPTGALLTSAVEILRKSNADMIVRLDILTTDTLTAYKDVVESGNQIHENLQNLFDQYAIRAVGAQEEIDLAESAGGEPVSGKQVDAFYSDALISILLKSLIFAKSENYIL